MREKKLAESHLKMLSMYLQIIYILYVNTGFGIK